MGIRALMMVRLAITSLFAVMAMSGAALARSVEMTPDPLVGPSGSTTLVSADNGTNLFVFDSEIFAGFNSTILTSFDAEILSSTVSNAIFDPNLVACASPDSSTTCVTTNGSPTVGVSTFTTQFEFASTPTTLTAVDLTTGDTIVASFSVSRRLSCGGHAASLIVINDRILSRHEPTSVSFQELLNPCQGDPEATVFTWTDVAWAKNSEGSVQLILWDDGTIRYGASVTHEDILLCTDGRALVTASGDDEEGTEPTSVCNTCNDPPDPDLPCDPLDFTPLFQTAPLAKGRIGIGGSLTAPPLPHHRAYGSVHGGSAG